MTTPRIDNVSVSLADERDYWFAPLVTGNPPPAELDLDAHLFAVPDQAGEGSCLAHGVVGECMDILAGEDLSRQYPYYRMREAEGRLNQDGGSLRGMLDVCRKQGIPLASIWPYLPENENTPPSPEADADAATRKIERFETLYYPPWHAGEHIDLFKRCLAEGNRIITVMPVTAEYTNVTGDWHQQDFLPYGKGRMLGYHCQRLVGYSDSARRWLHRGSWGPRVGDGGYFALPYGYTNDIIEARIIRTFAGKGQLRPPGIYCTRNDRTGISAQIVPTDAEDGRSANVWIGGLMGGVMYIKSSSGTWLPYDHTIMLRPTMRVVFDGALDIRIADGDLSSLAGTDAYVAYGNSPLDWHVQKICTV